MSKITVYTSSDKDMPKELANGYKVLSGYPSSCPSKYTWILCPTEHYSMYHELDLVYDIKTIEEAQAYLESIPANIKQLQDEERHLKAILSVLVEGKGY